MPVSFSLTNQGATPNYTSGLGTSGSTSSVYQPKKPTSTGSIFAPISSSANPLVGGTQANLAPKPTTPLKQTVTKNADGSSTTNVYHAPTDTNAVQKGALNTRLADLQKQLNTAQNAGYTGSEQIQNDAQGNVIPKNTASNTYSGMIQQLGNASIAGNEGTKQAQTGLLSSPEQNKVYADRAQQIANEAGTKISDIGQKGAMGQAGYLSTGTSPVGEGNSAILGQTTAAQQNAVTQGANMALTGNAQGLTAQQQAQSGLTNAGTLGTNAQQLVQSGLTSAAGAAKPSVENYGVTSFNPLTGEFAGGGQYGTGPVAAANVQSIKDLTTQKNQLQSTFNGAKTNYQLLLNTAEQGGVNQGDVPALNQLQQNVQRGLASNQAVINFQNTLATVRSQYAQILGGGTTTVDSQNRAEQAIPNDISLNALRSLGDQLEKEAANRIGGIDSQIGSIGGSTGNSGGTSTSTGGNITWDNIAD